MKMEIVATLGPSSWNLAAALASAGATSFRINASHVGPAKVVEAVGRLRQEMPDTPVVVDLQGAKLRLGVFEERAVAPDEVLRFGGDVPLPHPELFASVRAGETLSMDDDRLRFRVTAVSPGRLEAVALKGGVLRPRKGVNVVEHPVLLDDLPAHDRVFVDALSGAKMIAWAFSFMKDGSEAAWLRRRAPGAAVVGKIEHPLAVINLAAIDAAVDVTWICRGDLGAQLGMAGLARFVASLAPLDLRRPMLMAGQVLEHLTEHPEPTRSEVCHFHDLMARGFAGVVLSDETAIGRDPVGAVGHAAALARAFAG